MQKRRHRMHNMHLSQTRYDSARSPAHPRISFPRGNKHGLRDLALLGHDRLIGARARLTFQVRFTFVTGGDAMMRTGTYRGEITA